MRIPSVGILEFIFGMIVFFTVGSVALTYYAGRALWRGGKRLMNGLTDRNKLPGQSQGATREAQDVVVEPVEDAGGQQWTAGRGPQAPEGARRGKDTPASRAKARATSQRAYVRLDVDDGDDAERIAQVMRGYEDDEVLGERASAVIDTLRRAERRRQIVFAELDGTFQRDSISWQHFAAPAQAALDSLLRNSALLANRIQAFDTEGYLRLRKSMAGYHAQTDDQRNASRERRWLLYKQSLESLDTLQETNEALLLELDKLTSELGVISDPGANDESEVIIQEIRRLVDEAKYYRN